MKAPFVHHVLYRDGRSVFYGWWIVFSVAGPAIAGYVHDAVDTHDPTFLGFAALSLVSAAFIWQAKRPTLKRLHPPPVPTRP